MTSQTHNSTLGKKKAKVKRIFVAQGSLTISLSVPAEASFLMVVLAVRSCAVQPEGRVR